MSEPYARVVPAYPYEGALFRLIDDDLASKRARGRYYQNLYGARSAGVCGRAGALACLFKEIVFASADVAVPEPRRFLNNGMYRNTDLDIVMDWSVSEWDAQYKRIARGLKRNSTLRALLAKRAAFEDESMLDQFLYRIVLQIDIARKNEAILLGGGLFKKVYDLCIDEIARGFGAAEMANDEGPLTFEPRDLHVLGLNFSPANLEAFAAIRNAREIRRYGEEWRQAISSANAESDMHEALCDSMERAMNFEAVSKRACGAFEATGSFATYGALVPVFGAAMTAAAIGSDVGARAAREAVNTSGWYAVGAKMSEITLRAALAKRGERKARLGSVR